MHYKMINLDSITNENNKEQNEKWPYIPDHPYRILIVGYSGSGKTNVLINLINEQNDIDKIYLYARDLSEPKYKYLIKKRENAGIKHLNNPNAFIECSNMMDDVYENIHDYNSSRKRKILIVFDDMIADIMTNKKFQAIIKELFIRCRKLNISLVFITQSYFSVPKDVRLNLTHYLIMKINNRIELKNIVTDHSEDIDYQDFKKIYREYTKEQILRYQPVILCDLEKICLILIKMTVTDQVKILIIKIMQNKAQYELDRKTITISAFLLTIWTSMNI